MDEAELKDRVIPHLKGQLERASAILFTGAGVSLGAKNIRGDTPPLAAALKQELWSLCFPGEAFNPSSSLGDVFHAALTRHRKDLESLLTRVYTIDAGSIPEWYRAIFSMPWRRYYTLNVDDLVVAADRKFGLPRRPRVTSAVNPVAGAPSETTEALLDVIHLNGMVSDGPDAMTFSIPQYAQRLASPEAHYLLVSADLLSHSFVFIGTQLDEPPLWQHLELRRSKGGREMRELRPKSYLVTPSLDSARKALLSEFNVVWLPMTAEEFAARVLDPLKEAARVGLTHLAGTTAGKRGSASLDDVAALARTPMQPSEFLLGQEPIWADLQGGRAIGRESDEAVWTKVNEALNRTALRGLVVITGTAGSGKSAALMRACLRLTAGGVRVGWLDRDSDLAPREIRQAMRADDAPQVLAIDDADLFGAELSSLVREIAAGEKAPLVLGAVRAGKVDRVVSATRLEGIPIEEITVPGLTDKDIAALLDVLDRENRLGVLKGKPRQEQERIFREKADRQLLVAMIEATTNRRFEDKAIDELFDLDADGRQIYTLVAIASAFRFYLGKDEILIASGQRSNVALNIVDQLVRRSVLVPFPGAGGGVRARHRVIAEILLQELQKRGLLRDGLFGLALLGATQVRPDMRRGARPWRLLRSIINHDFLERALGCEDARNLYGSIEQLLHWDYHYWLQRGSLEVEFGDLSLAENFLNQAKGLASDDEPFLENERAYLFFKQALESPTSLDAPKRVDEATKALDDLIGRRGKFDPYPYHVLGSQGLSWARRGLKSSQEKGKYLSKLIKRIDEGVRNHPKEIDLQQLLDDLRREYMSVAVKTSS